MSTPSVNRRFTPKRRVETDEYGRFVRRIVAAHGRRVADGDIEALSDLAALSDDVTAALTSAVGELHDSGYSWAEIGARLGTSRQNVFKRFGGAR